MFSRLKRKIEEVFDEKDENKKELLVPNESVSTFFFMKFQVNLPVVSFRRTGSRYICNPPAMNTDEDWIVLVATGDVSILSTFMATEWTYDGKYYKKDKLFLSFRKGDTNLIVTNNIDYYLSFCAATELAKEMNLTDKKDRIKLFHRITGRSIGKKYCGPMP